MRGVTNPHWYRNKALPMILHLACISPHVARPSA